MIWILTGDNNYQLRRRLAELTDKYRADHSDLGIERIDVEDSEPTAIIEAVQSPPFLSNRKLIIVRDLSSNKTASEKIEQIISSVLDTNDLIIFDPQVDRRSSYFKVLKSQKGFEDYSQAKADNLPKWLVESAQEQGAKLTSADANYLVERIGEDQLNLANELDKLISYDPAINRQNIDLLTEKTPQSRVFDLLDAVFAGNKRRAQELYGEQRAQKVEPQAILALLVWQLEMVAIVSEAGGKTAAEIAKETGLSPYPLNKARSIAAKLTKPKLKELIDEIYKLDLLAKTKSIDLDEALKSFITTV